MKRIVFAALLLLMTDASGRAQSPASAPDGPAKDPQVLHDANDMLARAILAQKNGDFDIAIDLYTKVMALFPQSAGIYDNRGDIYLARKDYALALADYNKAISLDSTKAAFFNHRGILYQVQKQCDLAINDFNTAISLNSPSDMLFAHAYRGSCRLLKKDYAQAIADFDQAIALDISGIGLDTYYAARAFARHASKDYPGAVADYSEAIRRDPRNARYLSSRALAHQLMTDYDAAIADYTAAIEIEPNAGRFNDRGIVYHKKQDEDAAIADFQQAIKLNPTAAPPTMNLASAYGRRKDFDHAQQLYDQAIQIYGDALRTRPDDAELLNSRCWARALANRELDLAMADCDAALSKMPGAAHILDSDGFVWFRKGDFGKAIAEYDLALAAEPDLPGTLYKRGVAKIRNGDAAGGKADIAQARAQNPHAGEDMAAAGVIP